MSAQTSLQANPMEHFLKWGSLFPDDSSLCQVDERTNKQQQTNKHGRKTDQHSYVVKTGSSLALNPTCLWLMWHLERLSTAQCNGTHLKSQHLGNWGGTVTMSLRSIWNYLINQNPQMTTKHHQANKWQHRTALHTWLLRRKIPVC